MHPWKFFWIRVFIATCLSAFLLGNPGISRGQVVLDTWLVGQYNFNHNTLDSSGYRNNFISTGFTYDDDRYCRPQKAIRLDGKTALSLALTNSLANDQYSFTLWVKVEALPVVMSSLVEIGSAKGSSVGQRISLNADGAFLATSGVDGSALQQISTARVPIHQWVFIAVVRERKSLRLYLDGVLVTTASFATILPTYYATTPPEITVGGSPNGTGYFTGLLDDLHLYREPLDSPTILALYGYGTEKAIAYSPRLPCVGHPVSFTIEAMNTATVNWDFGDPGSGPLLGMGPGFMAQHIFSRPGTYLVTGTLATNCGVHAPVSQFITVGACLPLCRLPTSISVGDSCLENTVVVGLDADPSVQSVSWDFGDQRQYTTQTYPFSARHVYAKPGTYTLTAEVLDTCVKAAVLTRSVQVFSCQAQPLPAIPSAFSPNGDGINDLWTIPGLLDFPKSKVRVFDRWGTLVFTSLGGYPQPFDGTYRGAALPAGPYYYLIELKEGTRALSGAVSIFY